MAVNLTSGAISKIMTGKCTDNDLKPVLQVTFVELLLSFFISNKLQKGSIVQLTNFQLTKPFTTSKGQILSKRGFLCFDLTVIHTKCGIIGDPDLLFDDETSLVERSTPTIPHEDHARSHHVEEPPTQKGTSHSSTQNKKRKLQSSDDIISGFGKDISTLVNKIMEKTIQDGLGACYKKLETLEDCVSKMMRMMMEKNKEDDMGACIEKLDKMGWGAQEPIYNTALLLFGQSADYRKLWLHLKPESCGNWVKNAGRHAWKHNCVDSMGADYRKCWLHLKPESCGKWVKNAGIGDRVMLKVSPWKGVVRFGKRRKLNPRYVGPFKVLAKVGAVAYKLELPQEMRRVHNTFHVSNFKK
ncbi:hypothetical protein Tco_0454777 [Tanacetum coccineum]